MNAKRWVIFICSMIFFVSIVGCASNKSTTTKNKSSTKSSSQSIPPSSKFSKIKEGMPKKQVTDLIGYPNDMKGVVSGKAFNPFYYGRDTTRLIYYYKNEGHILFSGANDRVIKIVYDPNEDGYKD